MTSSSLTSSIRIKNLVRSDPEIKAQTKTDDSSVKILKDLHFMIRNFQVIYNLFNYNLFIHLFFRNQKLFQKSLSQRRLKIKIFKQQKQLICVLQVQV